MQESSATERTSAREFVERELRSNPELGYAEIQVRAQSLGLTIPRFLYGSIRRALGLPPLVEGDPRRNRPDESAAAADDAGSSDRDDAEAADATDGDADDGDAANAEEADRGEAGRKDAGTTKKGSAFELAVEVLRMSPDITYQDLKARAAMAGLQMPPIVYGRAKALLGLVPTRPRKPRVEAPRVLRQVESAADMQRMPALEGIRSLEQLVGSVRALEGERQRLLQILRAIRDTVDAALREADGSEPE